MPLSESGQGKEEEAEHFLERSKENFSSWEASQHLFKEHLWSYKLKAEQMTALPPDDVKW